VCFCQPSVHNLGKCGTALPLEQGDHLGRLGGLFGFGAFLAGVVFLAALAFAGAPLAACAPPLALFWLLAGPSFVLAAFFAEAFSGATVGAVFRNGGGGGGGFRVFVVIFRLILLSRQSPRSGHHHSDLLEKQGNP